MRVLTGFPRKALIQVVGRITTTIILLFVSIINKEDGSALKVPGVVASLKHLNLVFAMGGMGYLPCFLEVFRIVRRARVTG